MIRNICIVTASIIGVFLIGCGGFDQNQIVEHPDTVLPSSIFEAILINAFVYMDSSSTVRSTVYRNELHLFAGLPDSSWSVVDAGMAIVSDMDVNSLMAMQEGEIDEQTLNLLIEKYRDSTIPLFEHDNQNFLDNIRGMTFNATDMEGNEDSVAVDDVENWIGLSGLANIRLEQGRELDTILPLDSMDAIMGELGGEEIDPMIQALLPDSIGVSIVPILVYVKLQAGSQETTDTLYYYTKTGDMELDAGGSTAPLMDGMNPDVGSMSYVPVTVTNNAGVRIVSGRFSALTPEVTSDYLTGRVTIDLGSTCAGHASIGIYSIAGELIKTLMPTAITTWNGTDKRGNRVPAGTYLVKISTADGSMVRNVQIVQ